MLIFIIISVTIIIAAIIGIIVGKKRDLGFNNRWLTLFFTALVIAGVWLIVDQESQIIQGFHRRSWPMVRAEIINTRVTGERAYNPEITYLFQIDSAVFINKSNLHTPGFGRKRSRKQTSEIIVAGYKVGDYISVHYNPENPSESCLRAGPYWSEYMQLSTGILILCVALVWIVGRVIFRTTIFR